MTDSNTKAPYFDASCMDDEAAAYVAWIDVMGVRMSMLRSVQVTANFVFKLHVALLEGKPEQVSLYPVMDGAYIVSPDPEALRTILQTVFRRIARAFVDEKKNEHRFLIKASVACGPVIHGRQVGDRASPILAQNPKYRDSVLLGSPMVLAAQTERLAPPFGVYLDNSASNFLKRGERKFSNTWWPWFERKAPDSLVAELRGALDNYFAWCSARAGAIGYEHARINSHVAEAREYLIEGSA